MLPAAIVETMLGESYPNEIRKIPLVDKTMRSILDMQEDLSDQLSDQLKTSPFSLQVDEATDVVKYAHLITASVHHN
jgi:hypothetical protein